MPPGIFSLEAKPTQDRLGTPEDSWRNCLVRSNHHISSIHLGDEFKPCCKHFFQSQPFAQRIFVNLCDDIYLADFGNTFPPWPPPSSPPLKPELSWEPSPWASMFLIIVVSINITVTKMVTTKMILKIVHLMASWHLVWLALLRFLRVYLAEKFALNLLFLLKFTHFLLQGPSLDHTRWRRRWTLPAD